MYRKTRRGFTLTEMAIVLGVMGAVLGGIWAAASAARQSQKITQAQQQMMSIAQSVRSLYGPRRGFTNVTLQTKITNALINAGGVPTEMVTSDPTFCGKTGEPVPCLMNPWGGVTVVYASSSAPDHVTSYPTFEIQFSPVPSMGCRQILGQIIPLAANIGLKYVNDGDGWIDPSTNPDPATINCPAATNLSTEWALNQ